MNVLFLKINLESWKQTEKITEKNKEVFFFSSKVKEFGNNT